MRAGVRLLSGMTLVSGAALVLFAPDAFLIVGAIEVILGSVVYLFVSRGTQ